MSNLITQSLISSVEWCKTAPSSFIKNKETGVPKLFEGIKKTWKEQAFQDLVNTLSRIWTTPNAAIQRGIDFEKNLNRVINEKPEIDPSPELKSILDLCKDGIQQKKTKSFIKINGVEYCLYGKIDYDFPEEIIDLKTTAKYKGERYYLNSFQHLLYCYSENKSKFKYLIAEFNNPIEAEDKNKITNVIEVDYFIEDPKSLESVIIDRVQSALYFLQSDSEL